MKITIDTKNGEVKVNGKLLKDAPEHYKSTAEYALKLAYNDNYPLSEYETDCMWMSYRYCIGRHTIASHAHANDIWKNCRGRMSKERELFNAYDMNKSIEDAIRFKYPCFWFPIINANRIYTTAIDIVCQFIEDYKITSKEEFLKYKDIHIIPYDNEAGYKLEVVTWDEYFESEASKIFRNYYGDHTLPSHICKKRFDEWVKNRELFPELKEQLEKLYKEKPNPEYFYMSDFEDLFVWNDLVHCFDWEHHHKSILVDGTECTWFWTWTHKSEQREDGYYYKAFGYKKIRVPLDKWNGSTTVYIPDESIEKDIY